MSDTADPSSIKNFERSGPHLTDRITARSASTDGPDENGEPLGARPFGDGTAPGPIAADEAVR